MADTKKGMIMIRSITKNKEDVYIKADDLVKTFYIDLDTASTEVREYILASIAVWDEFIQKSIENANHRR